MTDTHPGTHEAGGSCFTRDTLEDKGGQVRRRPGPRVPPLRG